MNLWKRFKTFWQMAAHLARHPTHIEERWVSGPRVFGFHVGIHFECRFCVTCGYLKTKYEGMKGEHAMPK